jgi:hypothetical protein
VFGGFTPVNWESHVWNGKDGKENNCVKGDDSMRSFLFTLRNPHGVPPRKFALREEKKGNAILCVSDYGPVFYNGISVRDNCNNSYTWFGTGYVNRSYVNDTRFKEFLTGAEEFTVKEIEVFEIT